MPDIRGKVALITGSSSGIGAATAEYFASLGCHLSLMGRNESNLNDIKQKCLAAGLKDGEIFTSVTDLNDKNQIEKLINDTIKTFGKLDILVNSAGIISSGPFLTMPVEDYDKIMNTNVRSLWIVTQLCLPHLIKTKGTVVNVSSIAGPCAFPNVMSYCVSKAAVDQFTKCLALEMAPYGVRVNAVNPGVIVTNIHKSGGMSDEQYKTFLERSKSTHALGRVGEAAEVAKAVGFLASADSSFTTGDLLRVDGGRGIMTPR